MVATCGDGQLTATEVRGSTMSEDTERLNGQSHHGNQSR
jgi:hypothetical protein